MPTRLESEELTTTLLERSATNWIFFEHLHPILTTQGIFDQISRVRFTTAEIGHYWHPFNEEVTDAAIEEMGPAPSKVQYDPDSRDVSIRGAGEGSLQTLPLGITRLRVEVPSGVECDHTGSPSGRLPSDLLEG